MSELVSVPIACPCPGTPHPDGDTVFLRPKLGLGGGVALQSLLLGYLREVNEGKRILDWEEITGILSEGYLLNGVSSWTLLDEDGKPVPVTRQTIGEQLLDDFTLSSAVGSVADGLYYDPVLAPLLTKLSESSTSSQTSKSTSATGKSKGKTAKPRSRSTPRSSKPPKPLRPSSTFSTQTDSTAVTLVALERASTG